MQIIIDELMQAFEITDIKYFAIFVVIVLGGFIIWKLSK